MDQYVVLIGGGILSACCGLLGIWINGKQIKTVEQTLTPEELKSYRTQRLVSEGLSFCTFGRHYYRAAPGQHERGACTDCLPPIPIAENVIERVVGQAQEGRRQFWNRGLNFGKSYRPLYMDYPDLWKD